MTAQTESLFARAARGPQIGLFTGADLTAWRPPRGEWRTAAAVRLDPKDPGRFQVAPGRGVLVNGPKGRTVDLLSAEEFGDAWVHVEFCIPKGSNSGVYLMGRYELQIYDSYGSARGEYPGIECGGIYPRWIGGRRIGGRSPLRNVSRPPGQWQSFDILFRAPRFDRKGKKIRPACFLEARHNGTVVHRNAVVNGPTRAARFADEKPKGPLMLQGDHGPAAYRNIWIRPIDGAE